MSVRVQINDVTAHRTSYNTGDPISGIAQSLNVPLAVLPLLFDSQMAGDGGNKAMKTFLTGVASDQFDPSVHFAASDPATAACADLAKRNGKLQPKAIVAFCEEQRASKKAPPPPTLPSQGRPAEGTIIRLQNEAVALQEKLNQVKGDQEFAVETSRKVSQVANYLKALEEYNTKAKNFKSDTLGLRRQSLERLAKANLETLRSLGGLLSAAGYEKQASDVSAVFVSLTDFVETEIKKILRENPPSPSAPVRPTEPDHFAEYRSGEEADGSKIEDKMPALIAQAAAAVQLTSTRYAGLLNDLTKNRQECDHLQQLVGAWRSYDETATDSAAEAQRMEVEWNKWDKAAKAITTAHAEFLTKQGEKFSAIISNMGAAVLAGRKLAIDVDTGITLDGLPIEEVSLSTRWRMEVCVMTAVARTLNSPVLLIDGADVLDVNNRRVMTSFLLEHVSPYFKHVVLTLTAKDDLSKETPITGSAASRWILSNGTATKL